MEDKKAEQTKAKDKLDAALAQKSSVQKQVDSLQEAVEQSSGHRLLRHGNSNDVGCTALDAGLSQTFLEHLEIRCVYF